LLALGVGGARQAGAGGQGGGSQASVGGSLGGSTLGSGAGTGTSSNVLAGGTTGSWSVLAAQNNGNYNGNNNVGNSARPRKAAKRRGATFVAATNSRSNLPVNAVLKCCAHLSHLCNALRQQIVLQALH